MDKPILRLLIQGKVADGRLPRGHIGRRSDGPGNGETCDGCGQPVTAAQMMMEGLAATGGAVRFHVVCFRVWDVERQIEQRLGARR